ncbi:MAG: cyanophycinase [Duganella sp.]
MFRHLIKTMLLAAIPLAATAVAPPPPQGTLVIIGGGLKADNAEVWQRVVALAGGPGARIAVLPAASANPERAGAWISERLNSYGAAAFVVPLSVRLADSDYRKVAEDAELARSVRSAGGVFFPGGDQSRITEALVRADGSRTAVLDAVWDVYRRGGVVAGDSAGAAIMSSTMFYAPQSVFATLRSGVADGRDIAPGLGFIGDDVFVDQHLLVRGRFARMIPAMLKKGYKLGLGIDENTAMVIDRRRQVEIVGAMGALLIDLSRASTDERRSGFNVSNAVLSYLDRGDRYDLATHTFLPSVAKPGAGTADQRPLAQQPVFSADILGRNAVVELMENLMNNQGSEAIGIATSGRETDPPEPGFRFTFRKTADSIGYPKADSPRYSILNLQLDIRQLDAGQDGGVSSRQ